MAKKLLAEAGYPNGLKKKLFPAGPAHLQNTEALQASAKAAGVELELVPGEHTPDFRARNFEVLMGNSGARLPDPFATLVQYAYNPDNRDEAKLGGYYLWRTSLPAPELTAQVDQSKSETDPEKRKALFQKIDASFKAMDPPLIVLLPAHRSLCDPGECEGLFRPSDLVDAVGQGHQGMSGAGGTPSALPPAAGLSAPLVNWTGHRRLAGRVGSVVLTLLGLLFLTFTMGRLLPNDPVLAITGAEVDKATYDRVFLELGLDRPMWQQFLSYLGGILHGDLGKSLTTNRAGRDRPDGGVPRDDRTGDRRRRLGRLPRRAARHDRRRQPRQGHRPHRPHRRAGRPFRADLLARADGAVRVLRQAEMGRRIRPRGRVLRRNGDAASPACCWSIRPGRASGRCSAARSTTSRCPD